MEDRYDDILISGKAKKGKPKNKALAIDVDDFFDDSAKESRDEPDSAQLPNVAKLQVQDNSAKAAAQGLLTPESANKENRSRSPTSPSRRRLKDRIKGRQLEININAKIPEKEPEKKLEESYQHQPTNLDLTIKVVSHGVSYDIGTTDLEMLQHLGRGAYGVVDKMRHPPSGITMAVKRLTYSLESADYKSLLMDLNVSMRAADCTNIVHFYGALFAEGDVWICMEVMDTSLDKFYKMVYQNGLRIEEPVLAKIVLGVTKGLNYLKTALRVIHRDVKPSNMLANKQGDIKLCDFSVSGNLVDSLSKTKIGAQPYMAPEKINPDSDSYFDVRSDIWSLGISLVEMSTGKFPYSTWRTPFDQIKQVVYGDSPSLPADASFSPEIRDFVNQCLLKDYKQRPKYPALLEHAFIANADSTNIAPFVSLILDRFGASR